MSSIHAERKARSEGLTKASQVLAFLFSLGAVVRSLDVTLQTSVLLPSTYSGTPHLQDYAAQVRGWLEENRIRY